MDPSGHHEEAHDPQGACGPPWLDSQPRQGQSSGTPVAEMHPKEARHRRCGAAQVQGGSEVQGGGCGLQKSDQRGGFGPLAPRGYLDVQIANRAPATLEELEEVTLDEWAKIPLSLVNNYVLSFKNRLETHID